MRGVLGDVRFAVRLLTRQPGFAAIAMATLAIGIGASATLFSLADALLLQPLPVPDPDRVVRVFTYRDGNSRYADGADLANGSVTLAGLEATQSAVFSFRADGAPETAHGRLVSSGFFEVLRLVPQAGRLLRPDDEGAGADVPIVISDRFWRRRFDRDPGVVGRAVSVNGVSATIVGVAPPGFIGVLEPLVADLWVPASALVAWRPDADLMSRTDPPLTFHLIGRLAPGATLAGAQAEVSAIGGRLAQAFPDTNRDRTFTVYPAGRLVPFLRQAFAGFVALLMGVTLIVLVIACVNLANLLLARAVARRREVGVRLSLGAGRARLVRQLLTENLIVAGLGGAGGVLLAVWATRAASAMSLPTPVPLALDLAVDARVLFFALAASALTVLVFGLAPALQASRVDLVPALKAEGGGGGFRRSKVRAAFLVSQLALSALLLVAAGLLVQSLRHAETIDLGFDVDRLLTFSLELDALGADPAARQLAYSGMVETIERVPGVASAAMAAIVPLTLSRTNGYVLRAGEPIPDRETLRASHRTEFNRVGPGYFATMGIPLVTGREFTDRDGDGAPPVVIVNETFARRFWPDESALGKRVMDYRGEDKSPGPAAEVIGVVGDAKYASVGEGPTAFLYRPFGAAAGREASVLVRAAGPVTPVLLPAIREAVADAYPGLPIFAASTMTEATSVSLVPLRLAGGLAGALGVVALTLAVIGVYGVLSVLVRQRTRELGIRVAVGARPRDVIRLVLRQSLAWTAAGLVVGLALAVVATRVLSSLLYGVSPTDPLTFAGVSAILVAAIVAASVVPARRATKVDPVTALRAE